MELSRRSFFEGGLALVAVNVLPKIPTAPRVPVIWADGIHDDTAGIQAMFDGNPFTVAAESGEAFRMGTGHAILQNLCLKTSETIHVRTPNGVHIGHCYWEYSGEGPMLLIHECARLEMTGEPVVRCGRQHITHWSERQQGTKEETL